MKRGDVTISLTQFGGIVSWDRDLQCPRWQRRFLTYKNPGPPVNPVPPPDRQHYTTAFVRVLASVILALRPRKWIRATDKSVSQVPTQRHSQNNRFSFTLKVEEAPSQLQFTIYNLQYPDISKRAISQIAFIWASRHAGPQMATAASDSYIILACLFQNTP